MTNSLFIGFVSRRAFLKKSAATAALLGAAKGLLPSGALAASGPEVNAAKLGFIALTDSSPLIIAKEKGLFEKYGMAGIEVLKQASWGATRDNLVLGSAGSGIDGAHILTPMPYLMTLGTITQNNQPLPMKILARLNLDGQGISVSQAYAELKVGTDASSLKEVFAKKKAEGAMAKVAVTFPGGTHDLWMRYWLAAGGINPDTDVETIVVPPPQMVANMKVGTMDAFCVGEPWNAQLVTQGIGYTAVSTGELWPKHPENGTDKVNAIINCHLLTGRIGKDGTGPFSITGQPNAMGGREVGGLATMLAAHMDIANSEHRAAVQAFWKSPRMAEKPGLKAVDLFEATRAGKIKALWIMATNPVVSMPNSTAISEAFETCPFVVVSDVTAATETARYAAVLLPAMGWGEKDGTVTNSERRISRQRSFMPAAGQAREDWRIVCDAAKRMGFDGFGYTSPAEIFAEHAALTQVLNDRGRALNLPAFASQDYVELHPQQWGGDRPFAGGRFETPDGKARFVPAPARPSESYSTNSLVLNTGRIRDQWHTMTRTGLVPRLFDHRAEPYVEMAVSDARRLGVRDAELVLASGPHGSSVARVLIANSVRDGEVFQPMHWSSIFASSAKANAATLGIADPVSGQPALKSAQVCLTRWPARWYGFGVMMGEAQLNFDYWASRPLAQGQSFECAGLQWPEQWHDVLGHLTDLSAIEFDVALLQSSSAEIFRCVAMRQGKMHFAFFASKSPVQASRTWLQQQLGKAVDAASVLAARPALSSADNGPILCACNGIGRNAIQATIAAMPGATLHSVCLKTTAGTGCGSCRPEIQRMILEIHGFAQAAE